MHAQFNVLNANSRANYITLEAREIARRQYATRLTYLEPGESLEFGCPFFLPWSMSVAQLIPGSYVD